MKKFAIGAVALLLLLSLVGCGTFGYNINSYLTLADYNNKEVVFVDKAKLDKAVEEALENLIDSYPEIKDKTEGKVADGDTVYIYYEGTLVMFEGETTLKVGSDEVKAVKGLNEALLKAEFDKDGVIEFDLNLDKDFTVPAFAKKAETDKKDETSKDETSKDEPSKDEPSKEETSKTEEQTSDVAPAAEETSKTETSKEETSKTETSYFAGKKTKFRLQVKGKTGAIKDGDELTGTLIWTEPGFEGGTYNKATEDEAAAKEEANKTSASASASASTSEEAKKAGFELKIGSDSFIDGFEDGLIGLDVAANTKKTLDLTFPNPYSSNKELSGMDVKFDVTILSVTEEIKRDPATQWDELKSDILEKSDNAVFDFNNVDEFKKFIEDAKKMDLVATKMLYGSTLKKVPSSDYKEYKKSVENRLFMNCYYSDYTYMYTGKTPTVEDVATYCGFTTKVNGKTVADLDKYYQYVADEAALSLKQDLALYQVAKKEGLTKVTKADIEEYISYSNNLYGTESLTTENFYDSMGGKDEAKKTVVLYKAQKFLAEKAPVVTVEK